MEDMEDSTDGVVPEAMPMSHRPTVPVQSQCTMDSLICLYFNLVRFAKYGNAAVIKRHRKSANIRFLFV